MTVIEAKSASAFVVQRGQVVRVTDLDGGQCADFVAFMSDDREEHLSQNWTRVNNWKIGVTVGDRLFTNRNRHIFTIVRDTLGVNDLLFPPCSRYVYDELLDGESQDGCTEMLGRVLEPLGVSRQLITDPLNVFMKIVIGEERQVTIEASPSRPGEVLELRAEADCIVGVTACPDDRSDCNNHVCTRIGVELV